MKKTLIATAVLLLAFIGAAVARQNHEFLFYAATLVVLLTVLAALDRKIDFSQTALWAFNAWMLMHLLGGMASIDGIRLYDYMLLTWIGPPYEILKYDQFVHVFCYFAIAILMYEAVSRVVAPARVFARTTITVLAASGVGGLNEVIEFGAVVIVAGTGVGGYTNTALDLVANLLGAILGTAFCTARNGWSRTRAEEATRGP